MYWSEPSDASLAVIAFSQKAGGRHGFLGWLFGIFLGRYRLIFRPHDFDKPWPLSLAALRCYFVRVESGQSFEYQYHDTSSFAHCHRLVCLVL